VTLCQTPCMNYVLQITEKQNSGGARAPPCTCLRAPLPGQAVSFMHAIRTIGLLDVCLHARLIVDKNNSALISTGKGCLVRVKHGA